MENFVLGIFQEQLAKFIVGFRKEQVNANLLNGKGEITDVSLNCSFLNNELARLTPYIELEQVHVSKLSFHVTAWANLKKAPIVVDIEHVTATVEEPLHFLHVGQRKRMEQITKGQLQQLFASGKKKPRGPYNIFDRILDNLTVEIKSIHVTFQPRGKFKTKRLGPWTPPKVVATLKHLRYVSVNEYGQEASPDEVWKHNRHHHHHEPASSRTFLIYKKLSMECNLSLHPADLDTATTPPPPPLLKEGQVEVQIAIQKRLRDGAIMAVQVDTTLNKVEVEVDQSTVPLLAHTFAGLQYCFAKDRAFEDPLLLTNKTAPVEEATEVVLITSASSVSQTTSFGDDNDETGGGAPDRVRIESNNSVASKIDVQDENKIDVQDVLEEVMVESSSSSSSSDEEGEKPPPPSRQSSTWLDRPVILLPNGLVIHNRLSFSLSIHHCTLRGTYNAKDNGYVQLVGKGVVAEMLWPKTMGGKGGYGQLSLSYISLQERHGARIRSILIGGVQADHRGPIERASEPPQEVMHDENFPLFEDRSIREDPLGLRHSFPVQACGVKSTVEFIDKVSSTVGDEEDIMVQHEIGIDRFDVVLDTESWCRALRFAMNVDGGGFDPRWHSGDWTEFLRTEMLVHPAQPLSLEEHVQSSPEIFLDEKHMISSDLFNVTARITNVELRVPAAVHDDVRSCDIIVSIQETMLLVSSALPRTFLSGKIGASIKGEGGDDAVIEFPNDPSDICYALNEAEDPSIRQTGSMTSRAVSTFRLQATMRGYGIRIVPVIPFCNASKPQQLLAPTELTMITCFEGEPPESPESNLVKIVLFVSILIHKLDMNCDFDIIAGAISTMNHHYKVAVDMVDALKNCGILKSSSTNRLNTEVDKEDSRIRSTFHGRRVLVRRQFQRSREAGGLSIAMNLEIMELDFHLWRQNVPLSSRFRPSLVTGDDQVIEDSPLPLVQLVEAQLRGLEVGVEGSWNIGKRRVVAKCCLSGMTMAVCDFDAECNRHRTQSATALSTQTSKSDISDEIIAEDNRITTDIPIMVEVVSFKDGIVQDAVSSHRPSTTRHRDILLRVEEQMASSQSISFACEVATGGAINLKVKEIETLLLLMIEALLMPTGISQPRAEADGIYGGFFPDSSVGGLLSYSFYRMLASAQDVDHGTDHPHAKNESAETYEVTRMLYGLVENFLSKENGKLLLRLSILDVLVFVTHSQQANEGENGDPNWYSLFVSESSISSAYFGFAQIADDETDMMGISAWNGNQWADLFPDQEQGFHHILQSEQSLHEVIPENSRGVLQRTLIPMFKVACSYHPSSVSFTTGDTRFSVDELENLRELYRSVSSFAQRCMDMTTNVGSIMSALRRSRRQSGKDGGNINLAEAKEKATGVSSPFNEACNEVAASIHAGRNFLDKMRSSLASQDWQTQSVLRQKQKEVDHLRCLVFTKERDRIAALALVASQMMGWIRMGGTHQNGQRSSTTATMWRYWAVLRRTLLIIFNAPGAEPVGFISLQGAQLRPLAGGRTKRDLKRGFALVEKSGMTHFFVALSGKEYEMWIREIRKALGICTLVEGSDERESNQILQSMVEPGEGSREQEFEDTVLKSSIDRGSTEDFPETQEMGSSRNVNAEASGRDVSLDNAEAPEKAVDAGNAEFPGQNMGLDDAETPQQDVAPLVRAETSEDQESSNDTNTDSFKYLVQDIRSPKTTRQLRQRLSAARAGTKTRLGSAFQSAKYNVKAAADKQRQLRLHHGAGDSNLSGSGDGRNPMVHERIEEGKEVDDTIGASIEKDDIAEVIEGAKTSAELPVPEEGVCARMMEDRESAVDSFEEAAHTPRKSQQIRQRLSSVKAGTKTRLGSVYQAAKQNVKAARDRTLSEESSEMPQPASVRKDADALGGLAEGGADKNDLRHQANIAPNDETMMVASMSDHDVHPDGTPRRGRQIRERVSSKLGAAVKSVRRDMDKDTVGSSRGFDESRNRFSLRRFSKQGSSFAADGSDSIRMKSIRVGSEHLYPDDAEHLAQASPLKKIEGRWLVHVDTLEAGQDAAASGSVDGERHDTTTLTQAAASKGFENKLDESEERSLEVTDSLKTVDERGKSENAAMSPATLSQPETTLFKSETNMQQQFRIRVVREKFCDDAVEKTEFDNIFRSVADVLALHTVVSEAVSRITLHQVSEIETEQSRSASGQMSDRLASRLGISPLDCVRLTGNRLASLVEASCTIENADALKEYQCEILTEFLNSILDCSLPSEACEAVTKFLGIAHDVVKDVAATSSEMDHEISLTGEWTGAQEEKMQLQSSNTETVLALSTACETELVRAESRGLLAQRLAISVPLSEQPSSSDQTTERSLQAAVQPSLPETISETLHAAMHQALMNVMAERDEAHAQLVAARVLHVHELEQERKKIGRLSKMLEVAEKVANGGGSPFFLGNEIAESEKMRNNMNTMMQDSDAELIGLCQQLAGEISAKTSASLEIIRLKESRKIERENELAEREALKKELKKYKDLLADEGRKSEEARRDAAGWKQSYEELMEERKERTSARRR